MSQPTIVPWWAVWGMGYTILWAFIVLAGIIVWRSTDASQYSQIVITALVSLATMAVGYYLGSSSSSDKKDDAAIAGAAPSDEASDAAKQLDAKLNA